MDATDADAVHNAIVAGLDECVPAAGVLLMADNGVWLALQTVNGKSLLGDLGGKKERGENLWQAAVREAFEEGGVDLSGVRLTSPEQVYYGAKHTGERSYAFFFVPATSAPQPTGDRRILEHRHLTELPDASMLHGRMQFAVGFGARLQRCFA